MHEHTQHFANSLLSFTAEMLLLLCSIYMAISFSVYIIDVREEKGSQTGLLTHAGWVKALTNVIIQTSLEVIR